MRKILSYLLVLAGLMIPASFSPAYCSGGMDAGGIDINEGGEGKGGGDPTHRSPALIPIEASYDATLPGIILNFLYDLGPVAVSLENRTTGQVCQTVIEACQGGQVLPLFVEAGVYEIRFTLENGRWYWGTFEIE